ncbi:ABC transporter substrate-binding protein [Gryllotalpicola protaetiae]|uniref:ABC transporter substrate-binding protein n=1 Tax=Gryllotalpicola protaetiae TaxID=2419771 RepID=A0A387BN57_9MICO|nr:ABC transporter substrate-binding protein [Gryllotalpicola protaetiae]AYG02470.1 ABC transporter substrate-binding protein [Gryllotalpicola protaetiae]
MNSKLRRVGPGLVLVAAAAIALTACAGNSSASSASSAKDCKTLSKDEAAKATSAADFGGLDCLAQAAEKEGHLNVITLPPSWANYGKIIAGFQAKYPQIKINSENPDGSSQDEVDAAKADKGQSTAPDVFDMGTTVLSANPDVVTPYKVQNWDKIPADFKDPDGNWYYDYTGLISIGYDSSKIKTAPKKLDDLLGSAYKNAVAIKDSPVKANESLMDVVLATEQDGGQVSDLSTGVDFFKKLKDAGNFVPTVASQATVNNGQTPVVLQWSFNNVAWGDASQGGNPNFKSVVLPGAAVGSYYNQAVASDAADPAAARLWEEYIYTPQVQNLYLAAGAYPAMLDAMKKDGSVDKDVLAKVGDAPSDITLLSADQATAAGTQIATLWPAAMG